MRRELRDYRTMLTIRYFEQKVEDLFTRGLIKGTSHPAIGQEAIAVGIASALARGDYVTSTHRGHGHFIAHGGKPARIMAELFGKATGYSGGRGGSQLMADYRIGFLGANGITGGSIAIATGAALSARLRGTKQVAACYFGDGAANQGAFHEALNLAAIWRLPVLYVCENNRYAMSTPVSAAVAIPDLAARAAAYGFEGIVVDGNDLPAMQRAGRAAAEKARGGGGPTLLECKTYRMSGHSRGDPRAYRTSEEEAEWRGRDPITRYARTLRAAGRLTRDEDAALKAEARAVVREAIAFAHRSPDPDPAGLLKGVYA